MSDWRKVRPPQAMSEIEPNVRCWQKNLPDGHLTVLRTFERESPEVPWRIHISISHRVRDEQGRLVPGRYPTWDEQKEAVWKFAPGKLMASYLPAEGEPYVNFHETTFHWWEVRHVD